MSALPLKADIKRAPSEFLPSAGSGRSCAKFARACDLKNSFATLRGKVKCIDTFVISRTFKHLAMTQRATDVVVTSAPMLLHAQSRKLVVLRMAFIIFGPIDQMDDVVNLAFRDTIEKPSLRACLQILRQFFEETRKSMSQLLFILELIRLFARCNFKNVAREFATRAPQVNLEREGVATRFRIDYPL